MPLQAFQRDPPTSLGSIHTRRLCLVHNQRRKLPSILYNDSIATNTVSFPPVRERKTRLRSPTLFLCPPSSPHSGRLSIVGTLKLPTFLRRDVLSIDDLSYLSRYSSKPSAKYRPFLSLYDASFDAAQIPYSYDGVNFGYDEEDEDSYGEMMQEECWMVISSFFERRGLVRQQLDYFDEFVQNTMQELVDENSDLIMD
ncbi:DNA-dependent RNA polymerase II [Marasmius sp. AFHP31]|nr:DNA-dependent RNA polymerase II [Marasmius sp. AFHP31]